ncbi:MAG: lysophospholipid acyltransferase family protein [Candidatus Riflebacteria bacterium]|nr:lysophospholipid acyltransferase family protein [Candidatus Riflebacteria bacterium]
MNKKGWISSVVIRFLFDSLTVEKIGWNNNFLARKGGRRVIYVCWHGSQFMGLSCLRNHSITALVSMSKDGDVIASAMGYLGYRILRGSSSRGAARSLLGLSKEIKAGFDTAITVDGPRGPRHKAKPGAAFLARRTGAAILPLGFAYSNVKKMKSWDQNEIPYPFSKVVFVTGRPIFPDEFSSEEEGSVLIENRIFECEAIAANRIQK